MNFRISDMFECIEKRLNHGRNFRGELVFSTYKTKQVKSKSIIHAKEEKNLYNKENMRTDYNA